MKLLVSHFSFAMPKRIFKVADILITTLELDLSFAVKFTFKEVAWLDVFVVSIVIIEAHVPVAFAIGKYAMAISLVIDELADVLTAISKAEMGFANANVFYELAFVNVSVLIEIYTFAMFYTSSTDSTSNGFRD